MATAAPQNWWDAYPTAQPASAGPPRVIQGPPPVPSLHPQETPAETTIDQGHAAEAPYAVRSAAANAQRAEAEAATAQANRDRAEQQRSAPGEAQNELLNVIRNAVEARRLSREGNFTTGGPDITHPLGGRVGGVVAERIGGTSARDLAATLDTIKSNVAFSRLQRMRQESPTGGAVGNVSDADLRLLASTIASLDPGQSDERFQRSMANVIDAYARVYRRLGGSPHDLAQLIASDPGFAAAGSGTDAGRAIMGAPPAAAEAGPLPPAPPTTGAPPLAPSDGPQQRGPIEFGAAPQTPTGFEQSQIAAYDAFWHNNPHATVAQLQAAFPMVSNAQEIITARDRGGGVQPGSTWRMARPNTPPVDITSERGGSPEATSRAGFENIVSSGVPLVGPLVMADQAWRGPEAGNALLHGAQDWTMLGGRDEASAGFDSAFGNGSYDLNIARQRGVDQFDYQNHFSDRLGGQIAAGLPGALMPGGIPAQMGRSGTQGLLYGFGSGEGGFADRAPNALLGGTIGAIAPPIMVGAGAATGAVGRRVVNALRGRAVTPEGQAVAQAAQQEGVPISRPIVDPASRDRMMHLEASRGSGDLIRAPLANAANAIEARAGQLGAGGTVEEAGSMGQRIQGAGQRFIQESRGVRDRLYNRAATMAGNATVHASEAVAAIDRHLAELSGNPTSNAAEIDFMRGLRSDLVDEQGNLIPKTVAQIRDLRTSLRGRVSNANLLNSPVEGRVLDVLGAAKGDIARDLTATAPRAVAAYARADAYNTLRHNEIKQVVQRVIGPRDNNLSGEQVWERFRSMAGPRGNSAGVARLWNRLSADEQRDAAATLAERASPNGEFTAATFVRFTDSISPAAARTVFGPEGAQSIANLRLVSRALQQTEKRLNNSRSGAVSNWREAASRWREALGSVIGSVGALEAGGGGGAAVSAAVGGAVLGMATRSVGVQIRRMSARSLMNPDMSRWLAVGARLSTPQAVRSHIGRLSAIAARDPAIAQEVLGLRQSLLRAANDNFGTSAAASGTDGEPQGGNGQPGSPPR